MPLIQIDRQGLKQAIDEINAYKDFPKALL